MCELYACMHVSVRFRSGPGLWRLCELPKQVARGGEGGGVVPSLLPVAAPVSVPAWLFFSSLLRS